MIDPVALLRQITAAVQAVVDTEPEPLSPTPCPDWTYGQLLGHLVGGDRMVVGVLGDAGQAPSSGRPLVGHAGDRPPAPTDYQRHSARLATLLADPAVRSDAYELPVGRLPGDHVVLLRSVEHLLHGWDLARAAGRPTSDLEPAAAVLAEPALALLAALGETTLAGRRPFAPAVDPGPGAGPLARFVAAFGRDPGWLPDPATGYARLIDQFAGHDDVELPDGTRRGFGADGLRVRNLVFACPHQGRLMIKLPATEVDSLIGAGLGVPLGKPSQRPMREWVLVPFDAAAGERAEQAYAFVAG